VSMPKIALVYDAVYPYVKGGGERRFYEFGTRLAASGYEVHWYGMKYWDGPNTIDLDGIHLHGLCKARPLYTKSGRRSISEAIIFGLSCFKLLFADFDVIDCCGFPYFSLFPAKLAAFLKHKKLYSSWYEVWGKKYWKEYLGILGIFGFWVEKIATKLPDHIIATSKHTADLLQDQFGISNYTIVVNGVDTKVISKIKKSNNGADVMYAGRLMDFKNLHLIIEALAELRKNGQNLSCLIIGKGPAKAKLQMLAKKFDVEKQIRWIDFLEKSEDVYAYMKASKVFVLPSKREGFGIVVIEANASGTPALTANYSTNAAKDLIKDGVNGYVFEPYAKELASKIKKTIKHYKKLENTSKSLVKNYDWNNLSQDLVDVYSL
jgi:glycosyltransferase involved in cell wall biosynthesis